MSQNGSDLMSMGYSTEKEKSDKPGFEESEPNKTLCFNLNPKAGYFVHNNLLVGLDVGVAYSKKLFETGEYAFNEKTTLSCAGPFIRYYFQAKIAKPFLEITSLFGTLKNKYAYIDGTYGSKSSIISFGGGAGLSAPIGKKVSFDFIAGYNSMTVKDLDNNPDNDRTVFGTIGFKLGSTILLGQNDVK